VTFLPTSTIVRQRLFKPTLAPAVVFLVWLSLTGQSLAQVTLTINASFNGSNGATPYAPVTVDGQGNLFGTTLYGGAYNQGSVWEIANGSNTITTLASFSYSLASNGPEPLSGVTFDAQGNMYGTTNGGGAGEWGTVWEIAKGSNTITTLATFNYSNGATPFGNLIIDANGNLYGTAATGGANSCGTVFMIAKGSNTITTVANFDGTNGSFPRGTLRLDAQGNLYGTTNTGGIGNSGTVFMIAKGSNTITTLGLFNGTNGANPVGGVSVDSQGNIYGTTVAGGSAVSTGTVWEIRNGSNTITTLGAFTGPNGQQPTGDVTLDAQGNLYGTAQRAGPSLYGTVWEIANGSSTLTTLASFDGATAANPYAGLTIGANGQFYGTTLYGGTDGDGTVFSFGPTGIVPELPTVFPALFALALGAVCLLKHRLRPLGS
jgi:uncharacterized repeat protein (TIGR03803 family)